MKTIALYAIGHNRLMFTVRLILYTTFLSCTTGAICAQTKGADAAHASPDSFKINALQEVKVIAGTHFAMDTSGTPMQQLKSRDLERVNSLSVADAVRYFSGVQLKDYGGVGGLKTINVRSLGSNHTTVFYDGIALGNAQNGQVDLGKFSLDNIEEITLYEGQKSTIFQPASGFASASSLYLTARQPVFKTGTSSIEKVAVKTGSFGLFDPSAFWQYKISDHVYSTLSAEWMIANGRYRFRSTNGVYDTTAIRKNGDINARRVEAGFNGRFHDSSNWSAKFYIYNSQRGLPIAIVANNFGADTAHQRLWDRTIFLQTSYHKDCKAYSLMVNAKYTSDYTRYLDPTIVTTTGLTDNLYYEHQLYLSVSQLYHIRPWWNVSLANDYQYNVLDANLYHFAYPTRNTYLNALASEIHFPGFNLQASLLSTFVNEKVRQYYAAGNQNRLTPAVLLSWKPISDQNFRIRSFYKNIFRMPTFNDLYYTFIGNTALNPEFASQYDLGITYDKAIQHRVLTLFSIQADAYYNRVTNKIVAIPSADLFRWTMYNLGKVEIKGLEVNAQASWYLCHDLNLHTGLSYTHEQSLDKTGGEDNNQQIPYSPLNSGSLLISAEWRQIALNYSFIYTGSRYDESANIPANYVQPWYTHDLAMSWSRPVNGHLMKGSVEVNNLFNQYYEVITSFPMPGRSWRFTLQFTY
jgi:vitamin B12 transporter